MLRFRHVLFALFVLSVSLSFHSLNAQTCSGVLSNGQNLVTNGNFSQGYAGWAHDPQYLEYTPCGGCFSVPGNIYMGTQPNQFNNAFPNYADHTPTADGRFLMIDGICQLGVDLWRQDNIPIEPNTNYYFSVWISSMSTTLPPGQLQFTVNGEILKDDDLNDVVIDAPAGVVGTWKKFTARWYSGLTPPATATIRIENRQTSGCATAVDFAIDDISFSPGCDFGSPGPLPNLGEDFTICGKTLPITLTPGFDAATAARPDIIYRWYKDGVLQKTGMGPSFNSFDITSIGTYSVCTDSAGSCPKTDIITITDSYSINIGPDIELCNPITATLNAGYTGPGVTYQWYKNNTAINGETGSTFLVTGPGTYKVFVTDPHCGPQTSNTVTVTTRAAVPTDDVFCPVASGGTGTATLGITGSGKYKWWTQPTGGTAVATGNSYSPSGLTASTTYYVEDTSVIVGAAGRTTINTSGLTDWGINTNGLQMKIHIYQDVQIMSVKVPLNNINTTSGTITIEVRDGNGVPFNPVKTFTSLPTTMSNANNNTLVQFDFANFNLSTTWGTDLRLTISNKGNFSVLWNQGGGPYTYPYTSNPNGIIDLTGGGANATNNDYPYFYDVRFQTGVPCERVPVKATLYCPNCVGAVEPSSITPPLAPCKGDGSNITLAAVGGSGTTLVWYDNQAGVTPIGTGTPLIIPSPAVATTYYARWESPGCNSAFVSHTVIPSDPPSTAFAGPDQTICNTTTATLAAVAPTPVVGNAFWNPISGVGTITDLTNKNSGITGLGAGDFKAEWVITSGTCPDSRDTIIIHRDTLMKPVLTGAAFDTCASTAGVQFATSVNHTTTTYNWTVTGTLSVTGQSANTVTVDVGASGGTLTITEVNGFCSLSDSKAITITPPVSAANAGADRPICLHNTVLAADPLTRGVGKWTVTQGTGVFADDTDPNTAVSGLTTGVNIFTWTVTGCGGPLSSEVEITAGQTSSLAVDLLPVADILCFGTPRELVAVPSGGSGNYTYTWTRIDNNSITVTQSPTLSVSPDKASITYSVFISDNVNTGCQSSADQTVVLAVDHQDIYPTNLVTPNHDGKNDFYLMNSKTQEVPLAGTLLEVYNSWGNRVYRSENYDNKWSASNVADGMYYVYIKAGCGGAEYKGWLQILGTK